MKKLQRAISLCLAFALLLGGTLQVSATTNTGTNPAQSTFPEVTLLKNGKSAEIQPGGLHDTTDPKITTPERENDFWQTTAAYRFQVTGAGIVAVGATLGGEEITVMTTMDENYFILCTANGEYTVWAEDIAGNRSEITFTESKIDTNAPVISEPARQEAGWSTTATYTFSVTDSQSGVAEVLLDGAPLKAGQDGAYQFTIEKNGVFTIQATDNLGNQACFVREETQIDQTSPVISIPIRTQTGWQSFAEYSFSVTDDAILFVTVNGEPLLPDADNVYRFIAYTNGQHEITATDQAGNTASQTVLEAYIDTQAPDISHPVRQNSGWSATATYTFSVTDTQSGVAEVVLDGMPLKAGQDGKYQFTVAANGKFTIQAADSVGFNSTLTVTESYIDRDPPEISHIAPQEAWDAKENTVTMEIHDSSGVQRVIVTSQDGTEYPVTHSKDQYTVRVDNNGRYTVFAEDLVGNTATQEFQVQRIDTVAPSAPALTGEEGWVNTDLRITATSEDAQSGIVAYWYTTEEADGVWQQMPLQNGQGILLLTQEQDMNYRIVAEDAVGNRSEESVIHVSIDKTAPETLSVEYGTEGGYFRTVDGMPIYRDTLHFLASATDSASGIARCEYRIIGTITDTGWLPMGDGLYAGADDILTIQFRAYDKAGNMTQISTGKSVLENTPETDAERAFAPDLSLSTSSGIYPGDWTAEDVSIFVSGSNAVSGAEFFEYRIDYADPTIPDTDWMQESSLLVAQDTNATYFFRSISYAGNVSQISSATVLIQKTIPESAHFSYNAPTGKDGWYTQYPEYAVVLPARSAFAAPIRYVLHCNNQEVLYDGTNAPAILEDGIWELAVTSIDAAGNMSEPAEVTFRVDTQVPDNLSVTLDGADILNAAGTVQWNQVNILDAVLESPCSIFLNRPAVLRASAEGGVSGDVVMFYQVVSQFSDYRQDGAWMPTDSLVLEPDQECHIFFKAVDPAGNTTYFSGRSFLLDDDGADVTLAPEQPNKHGFYSDDVAVAAAIRDGGDPAFSGLKNIRYRILRDSAVTQTGVLFESDVAGIREWNGSVVIPKSSSNHVILEVSTTDFSGNVRTVSTNALHIDVTPPKISAYYDRNDPVTANGFTGTRTLYVTVEERNFLPDESFVYVSNGAETLPCTWESNGDIHTAAIPITEDGIYTVSASVTDAAGNTARTISFQEGTVAAEKFIIDNTQPTVSVSYDNNSVKNGKYFNDTRTLTVRVDDANFDPAKLDVNIQFAAEDGSSEIATVDSWSTNGNIHTASVLLDGNGAYTVSVSGSDALGNQASRISYTGASPRSFVIDQHIAEPIFSFIQDGGAYSGSVVPVLTALDANLDSVQIKVFATRWNGTEELVLEDLPLQDIPGGKEAALDIFPLEESADGQYRLEATIKDLAGNTATKAISFSVNRFGSVYLYDDYLQALLGGYYPGIDEDIVITEFNPSGVIPGSARIQISRDGVLVSDPQFTVVPVQQDGWLAYRYVLSKENFIKDGQYRVVISTKDEAGNIPECTDIQFAVDTTAPELISIVGLEKTLYNANSLTVTLSAMDNIALANVSVYLNGKEQISWTINDYIFENTFTIPAGINQHIRIVATDRAGNVLDTDSEDFAPGYAFHSHITISAGLFLGIYIGLFILAAIILIIVLRRRRH